MKRKVTCLLLALWWSASVGAEVKLKSWSAATADACIAGKPQSKAEVLAAINCLKADPVASLSLVKYLKEQYAPMLEADAELRQAIAEAERQKAARLYIKYPPAWGADLMVVDSARLAGSPKTDVYDLFALNLQLTHTSAGKDQRVPWQQVRSFSFKKGATAGTGELVTTLVDGSQVIDKQYADAYPLKEHEPGGAWRALLVFSGTTYPGKGHYSLPLSLPNLTQLTFLSEEEGKQQLAKFEEEDAAKRRKEEEAKRTQAEIAQREVERTRQQIQAYVDKDRVRKAPLLKAMAKAKLGTEDACSMLPYDFFPHPDDTQLQCQFSGKISLSDLKQVGWLVVSTQVNKHGVATEYFIRKSR